EVNAHGFSGEEIAFDLALVFAGHFTERDGEINGKAENAGVCEAESFGFKAVVASKHGERAFAMYGPEEFSNLPEDDADVAFGLALRPEEDNFAAIFVCVFDGVFKIEDIRGDEVGVHTTRRCRAGPAHGGDGEFARRGREDGGFGGA